MLVAVFRSRLRPENQDAYAIVAAEMDALVQSMPGFVAFKTFAAPDGERVSLVEFESEAALTAWREHPRHREAQARGRAEFYAEYRIQVCEVIRDYGHKGEDT